MDTMHRMLFLYPEYPVHPCSKISESFEPSVEGAGITAQLLRIDERNHVEKPLLDQLAGLRWEILDLDNRRRPLDSHRVNFTKVVVPSVLRERLQGVKTWLENDHTQEQDDQEQQRID